tara:strand:+ start:536 stop:1366 length:831 start_codon:yes stop_codon:yes gene_type:complete
MENYDYKDYKSLIEDIINGKYVINQPLKLDNNKVSFLGYLLNYSHINKSNIHKILLSILNKIKTELFKHNIKNNNSKMIEHVQKEWNNEENNDLFCNFDFSPLNNLGEHIQNKKNYLDFLNKLEEKFSEQKIYSKMLPENELEEYSILELRNSIDDINNKCSKIVNILDRDLNLIEAEKYKINNIDLSLLLDLSMKHINLYQQLSEEINNVSPNIHNSYMNYTLVFNLLKKQINHIHQIILDIKEDVIKKCKNINELLGETQSSRIKDKKQENLFF